MARKRKTLFDPSLAQGPRPGPDVVAGDPAIGAMSVSALVARIKSALAAALPERICVVGEISNLSMPASGHIYFSLKDSGATLGAAMWRSQAARLKFRPTDGMEVVVEGRVDLYDAQGKLQLYVERITPRGQGALELAFRQLREKLQAEGLFNPDRKKPIARFPRAVGVITSRTGAAVRDIQRTLRRRWPAAEVYLVPVPVQGDGAAEKIAQAVRDLDTAAEKFSIDTILLARGGGSLEDLWPFNEEVLARAVAAAQTPIVSGVGHEVDVTICDLVADLRAPTPTGAAEMATPDREEIRRHMEQLSLRLRRSVLERIDAGRRALQSVLRCEVFRNPAGRVHHGMQRLDELSHRLRAGLHACLARSARRLLPLQNRLLAQHPARWIERARGRLGAQLERLRWVLGGRSKRAGDRLADLRRRLAAGDPAHALRLARQRVDAAGRQLEALSYRSVLQRGFSVTRAESGRVIRSVCETRPGQRIRTELADGAISSDVASAGEAQTAGTNPPQPRQTRKKPTPKNPGPLLFD